MPEITITSADGSRTRLALTQDRVVIGRSRDSDIFLPDQWLSRHHAQIVRRDGGCFLSDLGSKNGTLLNGGPVSGEIRLRHGDLITLGEHSLTFSGDAEPAADLADEPEPEGTQVFSAQELSLVARPTSDTEELARQNRILAALTDVITELVNHKPLDELFALILRLLFQAIGAERGAILLLEGDPPTPVIKAARSRHGQPITKVSRSIARHVLEERVSLLIPNVLENAAFKEQQSIMATGIRSAVCAPLRFESPETGETVIGLVYLDTRDVSHSFDEDDLRVLTPLAQLAAAKIENVRLLEESLEKRRMEQDMQVAAEIQRGLLPDGAPEVPGYGVTGINQPCRTVGGDYYDFGLEGEKLLLALGDVSGKGTGAALLMTVLRAAVRAHWGLPDLAEAAGRINRTVFENTPPGKYITFFFARLEPAAGRLSYVNAGHNPPLLLRADGRMEKLQEGGMALGFFDTVSYDLGRTELQPGDALVIYSDGVTETWNAAGDEWGEEGLSRALSAAGGLDAASLQERLLEEVEAFEEGAKATDDRTLVVLARTPAP
jgi:sigma-B regulation protein RsbU (phosphoserine phosphatase)